MNLGLVCSSSTVTTQKADACSPLTSCVVFPCYYHLEGSLCELTVLARKNCFTQFSTRMAALLLLTFFNMFTRTIEFYTFHYHDVLKVQMFEKYDSSNRQIDFKLVVPFSKFYGKIWADFCLNTGKCFIIEVSFQSQQKEHRFF